MIKGNCGKTGISIIKAIISGTTDPEQLSPSAQGLAIKKIPMLQRALRSSVTIHQQQMLGHQIRHIEFLADEIGRLDEEIQEKTKFTEKEIELLGEIPGIGRRSAERIIAETGIVMEQFRSAAHFASWGGLVPECNESAGKKKTPKYGKEINS